MQHFRAEERKIRAHNLPAHRCRFENYATGCNHAQNWWQTGIAEHGIEVQ